MSHFYAHIIGSARTVATRCGTKDSGVSGHLRGWDVGARVEVFIENGVDTVRVYRTGGSNGGYHPDELIFKFTQHEILFPRPKAEPDPEPITITAGEIAAAVLAEIAKPKE